MPELIRWVLSRRMNTVLQDREQLDCQPRIGRTANTVEPGLARKFALKFEFTRLFVGRKAIRRSRMGGYE